MSLAVLPHREGPRRSRRTREELSAQPAQVAVVDGGTLRLRDRVVRLHGVEPPPRGTTCGRARAGEDCGAAATNALAALVREAPVVCRITGEDGLGRPYGICQASGTELNRAVVAAGWARADHARTRTDSRPKQAARAGRLGVWASVPTAVVNGALAPAKSRCKIAWQLTKEDVTPACLRRNVMVSAQADVTGRRQWINHIPVNDCYCIAT